MTKTINVTALVDSLELNSKEMLKLANDLLCTVALGNEDEELDALNMRLHVIRNKKYASPTISENGIEYLHTH